MDRIEEGETIARCDCGRNLLVRVEKGYLLKNISMVLVRGLNVAFKCRNCGRYTTVKDILEKVSDPVDATL